MITYVQALILGIVQGVTELFPISSLGHSVLIADAFSWHNILNSETGNKHNSFLLFLVVIHVATALALLFYYRQEWYRIIRGFIGSLKTRSLKDSDAKLAWLLIVATIPAGIVALVLQNLLRTQFAKPLSAIIFIMLNGCLLLWGDHLVAKQQAPRRRERARLNTSVARASDSLTLTRSVIIGTAQVGALFAGISRSGITMIGGMYSGLNHEDAARFSFLLATPIILAAGFYQLPDVIGSSTTSIHGQMLVGALCAAIGAYFSVRYLDKYFQNRTLRPFGLYCIGAGAFMIVLSIVRGHF
jgi:undecaprenyl-diphosphatase